MKEPCSLCNERRKKWTEPQHAEHNKPDADGKICNKCKNIRFCVGKITFAKKLAKDAAIMCIGAVACGLGADAEDIYDLGRDLISGDGWGVLENIGEITVDVLAFQTGVQAQEFTELGNEIWSGDGWGALKEAGDIVLAGAAYQAGVDPVDIQECFVAIKNGDVKRMLQEAKEMGTDVLNLKKRFKNRFKDRFNAILGKEVFDKITDYSKTMTGVYGANIQKYFDIKVRQALGKKILGNNYGKIPALCGALRNQVKETAGITALRCAKTKVGSVFSDMWDKAASYLPWASGG